MWRHMLSSLISAVSRCVVMPSLSVSLTAVLFTDRIMNDENSPTEKKQDAEGEKLPEETSTGENYRYLIHYRQRFSQFEEVIKIIIEWKSPESVQKHPKRIDCSVMNV